MEYLRGTCVHAIKDTIGRLVDCYAKEVERAFASSLIMFEANSLPCISLEFLMLHEDVWRRVTLWSKIFGHGRSIIDNRSTTPNRIRTGGESTQVQVRRGSDCASFSKFTLSDRL